MDFKIFFLLTGLSLFFGCSLDNSECSSLCTAEFRFVTVKFNNSAGQPVIVNDYKAVNLRTGIQIQTPPPDTVNFKGIYIVASDTNLSQLSASGDSIQVSAVSPATGQQKSARFVIAGGECNCHIVKKSGPQEIVFN